MSDNEEPHLTIDSHVVVQLGAELISDSEQALLELVKNSYDGDAKWCRIHIEPAWTPDVDHPWFMHLQGKGLKSRKHKVGRIRVRDSGTGLSPEAVLHGWLTISASLKRAAGGGIKKKTDLGRIPVGDKGLGRLATMRLGDVLKLRTVTLGEKFTRATSFAWSDFTTGVLLEKVPVKNGLLEPAFKQRKSGTDVEILGLNEPEFWCDEKNIRGVVSRLSTLISPFKQFKDFLVDVVYDEKPFDLQDAASEALNHAAAKFRIVFDGKDLILNAWFARYLFRGARGKDEQHAYDRLLSDTSLPKVLKYLGNHPQLRKRNFRSLSTQPGGWLFSVEDKISWTDVPRDPTLPRAREPGPFEAEIYYFLFNDETKKKFAASSVDIETVQSLTSVGVFRDGFRVRMSDDWLGLSEGTTTGSFWELRPKNVIGFFSISNEFNPDLVEKSDREGFVDNEAWRGFMLLAQRGKKFANDSVNAARSAYKAYAMQDRSGSESAVVTREAVVASQTQAREAAARVERRAASVTSSIGHTIGALSFRASALDPDASNRREILDRLTRTTDDVRSMLAEFRTSTSSNLQILERVLEQNSSLKEQNTRLIEAAAVGLSARTLAHEIATYVNQIEKAARAASKAYRINNQAGFDSAVLAIQGAIRELKKVISTIDPLLPGSRSLKNTFYVRSGVDSFLKLREKRISDAGVVVTIIGDRGSNLRFAETRFNQIFENLLQNSLFWLAADTISQRRKALIVIEIKGPVVTWYDNGKGIREAVEDTLFDAYVSDKPTSEGRGLGLFIVSAFLQSEKCDIILMYDRNELGRRYKFRIDFSGAAVNG